jgi:nitroreductase
LVVIAFGLKGAWRKNMEAIFREGVRRGAGRAEQVDSIMATATSFLADFPEAVWLNRHVMIAFTTLMLVAEAYGLDTAPMEGFDPEAVKAEFGLPVEAEVVALLAIGFAAGQDRPYAGRLALSELVHRERYGAAWAAGTAAEAGTAAG